MICGCWSLCGGGGCRSRIHVAVFVHLFRLLSQSQRKCNVPTTRVRLVSFVESCFLFHVFRSRFVCGSCRRRNAVLLSPDGLGGIVSTQMPAIDSVCSLAAHSHTRTHTQPVYQVLRRIARRLFLLFFFLLLLPFFFFGGGVQLPRNSG